MVKKTSGHFSTRVNSCCSVDWGQTSSAAVLLGTDIHGKVFFKTNHFYLNQPFRIDPLRWNRASCLSQSRKEEGGPPHGHMWKLACEFNSTSDVGPELCVLSIKSSRIRPGRGWNLNLICWVNMHQSETQDHIKIISSCFRGSKQWNCNLYVEYGAREGEEEQTSGFGGFDLHMLAFLNSCFLLSIWEKKTILE